MDKYVVNIYSQDAPAYFLTRVFSTLADAGKFLCSEGFENCGVYDVNENMEDTWECSRPKEKTVQGYDACFGMPKEKAQIKLDCAVCSLTDCSGPVLATPEMPRYW